MWKNQHAKIVKNPKKNSALIDINIHYKLIIIKIAEYSTKINKAIIGTIKNWEQTRVYTEIQTMTQVPFHSMV